MNCPWFARALHYSCVAVPFAPELAVLVAGADVRGSSGKMEIIVPGAMHIFLHAGIFLPFISTMQPDHVDYRCVLFGPLNLGLYLCENNVYLFSINSAYNNT